MSVLAGKRNIHHNLLLFRTSGEIIRCDTELENNGTEINWWLKFFSNETYSRFYAYEKIPSIGKTDFTRD